MIGTIVSVLAVVLLVAYVIGIFVMDHFRMKKGKPSIFLDVCEAEGKGRRLVKEFHKAYKKKGS